MASILCKYNVQRHDIFSDVFVSSSPFQTKLIHCFQDQRSDSHCILSGPRHQHGGISRTKSGSKLEQSSRSFRSYLHGSSWTAWKYALGSLCKLLWAWLYNICNTQYPVAILRRNVDYNMEMMWNNFLWNLSLLPIISTNDLPTAIVVCVLLQLYDQ